MPAAAGDIAKTSGVVVISRKTDATGVTVGDIVSFDTNGLVQVNPTTLTDAPFGIALETIGASKVCRVLVEGYGYCTADGAIKPSKYVIGSGSTAGQVVVATKQSISATPTQAEVQAVQNELWQRIGVYVSKENEEEDATDAADGNVIMIKLGVSF